MYIDTAIVTHTRLTTITCMRTFCSILPVGSRSRLRSYIAVDSVDAYAQSSIPKCTHIKNIQATCTMLRITLIFILSMRSGIKKFPFSTLANSVGSNNCMHSPSHKYIIHRMLLAISKVSASSKSICTPHTRNQILHKYFVTV